MNLFSSFTLATLLMLTMPIMMADTNIYKTTYPLYVKTISCAFISLMQQ